MDELANTLLLVNMQNDFVSSDGALVTSEAEKVLTRVSDKVKEYRSDGKEIFFLQTTHFDDYLETSEGKIINKEHCLFNEHGWQIPKTLVSNSIVYVGSYDLNFSKIGTRDPKIIYKYNFGYNDWLDRKEFIHATGAICKKYYKSDQNDPEEKMELTNFYEGGSVEIAGMWTETDVISSVITLKTAMPELNITVDARCCSGGSYNRHKSSLHVMKSIGITVKNIVESLNNYSIDREISY